MSKPNIVLIVTDQQRASATSVHGNTVVRTPAWDRAAENGAVFDNCISTSPVCTPARVGFMTGLYPLVVLHILAIPLENSVDRGIMTGWASDARRRYWSKE